MIIVIKHVNKSHDNSDQHVNKGGTSNHILLKILMTNNGIFKRN